MSFAEIEDILRFKLPASARLYTAWWSNDSTRHSHSNEWLSAGWRTEAVDLGSEKVTFRQSDASIRQSTDSATYRSPSAKQSKQPVAPTKLPNAPNGLVQVAIAMQWKKLGNVISDSGGKLSFPAAPSGPALYRLRLSNAVGTRYYIGEALNLGRRFSNYRNPGRTQMTSLRLNEVLRNHIVGGGEVEVDVIASDISLSIAGQSVTFALSDKAVRRLLEQAALVANHAIDIESLNR